MRASDDRDIEFFVSATYQGATYQAMQYRGAFRRRASLLRKAGTRGLSMSCNGQPDLWGGPSNFPVDGGKLVGQVAYYHFSIRRARGRCVLASVRTCVRACVRVNTPVSPGTLGVSPFGIRQGYRGCSGVLVVIGVGRTDHLNTRHCNHDRASSLSLSNSLSRGASFSPPTWHSLPIVQSSHFLIPFLSPASILTGRAWLSGEYLQITTTGERVLPFVSIVAWPDLLDENGIVPSIQIEVREAYRRGAVHFRSDFLPPSQNLLVELFVKCFVKFYYSFIG